MQHGTCAAQCHIATVFRSFQAKNIAEIPQQRHVRIARERTEDTINTKLDHLVSTSKAAKYIKKADEALLEIIKCKISFIIRSVENYKQTSHDLISPQVSQ